MCPNEVVSTFEFKRNERVEKSKYCCNENVYCPLAYQQNELGFASEIISEVFFFSSEEKIKFPSEKKEVLLTGFNVKWHSDEPFIPTATEKVMLLPVCHVLECT